MRNAKAFLQLIGCGLVGGFVLGGDWAGVSGGYVGVDRAEAREVLGGKAMGVCNTAGYPSSSSTSDICDACGGTVTSQQSTGTSPNPGGGNGATSNTETCGSGCTETYYTTCDMNS